MKLLTLCENPIDKPFSVRSIAGKELHLRAQLSYIDKINVLSLPPNKKKKQKTIATPAYQQITVTHTIPWPYYASSIILFMYGVYLAIQEKPDLLEAESSCFSGLAAFGIGKLLAIPYTIEIRSSVRSLAQKKVRWIPNFIKLSLINWIESIVFRHASALICNSKHYASQISPHYRQKTFVVNPGLTAPKASARSTHTPIRIGFLGRLEREKGCHILLAAVPYILKEVPIEVHVAGEGSQANKLKKQVQKLQVTNTVTFHGQQHNYSFLQMIDILVNTTHVEAALEMVNVEAASQAVPVVCIGDTQIPETVLHNKTGEHIASTNPKELANRIIKLCTNKKVWKQYSKAGPIFAQQFDRELQIKKLDQAYRATIFQR